MLSRRRLVQLGLLAVIVVLLFGIDQVWRTIEFDHTLDAVEHSERVMTKFQTEATDATMQLNASCAQYMSPACEQQVQTIRSTLIASAAKASEDLRVAMDAVQGVSVAFWHGSIHRAQDAYQHHQEIWISYLDSVTKDPSEYFSQANGAEISATFRIAHRRFDEAAPLSGWLFDEKSRISSIWQDDN